MGIQLCDARRRDKVQIQWVWEEAWGCQKAEIQQRSVNESLFSSEQSLFEILISKLNTRTTIIVIITVRIRGTNDCVNVIITIKYNLKLITILTVSNYEWRGRFRHGISLINTTTTFFDKLTITTLVIYRAWQLIQKQWSVLTNTLTVLK